MGLTQNRLVAFMPGDYMCVFTLPLCPIQTLSPCSHVMLRAKVKFSKTSILVNSMEVLVTQKEAISGFSYTSNTC